MSPSQEAAVMGEDPALAIVSTETKVKNAALAASLFAFCAGVTVYSMNAVGQAGSSGDDDPLAVLKKEAAEAQQRHDAETRSAESTEAMLKQFQAGEYDPDKYEEDDDEKSRGKAGRRQRPWWKFW